MRFSRREMLIGGAGLAAGFLFTPVPWKLLSDASIWTQNWPWIPQPPRGPVDTKQSFCTLCPAGCGIRVRMVQGNAVGIAGASSNPVTKGTLCPLGYAAHQLNWSVRRLRDVRHGGKPASWGEAQAAFQKACGEGPVSIIDGRPGRAVSSIFRAFARAHKGNYQVALDPVNQSLTPYAAWTGVQATDLGYDLENAGTIVSFGAPLLDGWGTPGRLTRLWSERAAGAVDPQLRLVQIEPLLSRSATLAWRWVPIGEGSEAPLAAGVARVLIEERLVKPQGPPPAMSLDEAAARSRLDGSAIRDLARMIVQKPPVLVISAGANPAVAALNVFLGSMGVPGGIVRKIGSAQPSTAADPAIRSPRAVLVDSSVPWGFVPAPGAEVFRFAAWDGGGSKADWLLPAPGFLEEATDLPAAPGSAAETYAVSANLVTPPGQVRNATQFLLRVDPLLPALEKLIHDRCEALFRARRGAIHGNPPIPLRKIGTAQKLEEELRKGALWVGDAARPGGFRCELEEWPAASEAAGAGGWTASWGPAVLPPLAGKLYRESTLREPPARQT